MTDQDQKFIREREPMRENRVEREEKRINRRIEERGERKENKKILINYTIFFRTVANMQRHYSYVAKIIAFETSDKMGFLVFGAVNVPSIWHLVHLPHLVWMLILSEM